MDANETRIVNQFYELKIISFLFCGQFWLSTLLTYWTLCLYTYKGMHYKGLLQIMLK